MRPSGKFVGLTIVAAGILVLGGLLLVSEIVPRMDWSATARPGAIETRIADEVRERWIAIHSSNQENPLASTPENLASARQEYNMHCAPCHGRDGSGQSEMHADFHRSWPRWRRAGNVRLRNILCRC